MFEQSLMDASGARSARPWTVPVAAGGQALLLAAALMAPLLFTEILPVVRLSEGIQAVPLAPAPVVHRTPDAPVATAAVRLPLRHVLVSPMSVPDKVTMVDDSGLPALGTASTDRGAEGLAGPGVPFGTGMQAPIAPPPAEPVHREPPPEPKPALVRIVPGGNVKQPELVQYVKPTYPPLARQARVQGAVRIEAVLSREGEVTSMRLASGPPLLVQAAMDAVRRWRYRPTLLNGSPVQVAMVIDVNFTLSQ
jgi:protein TonB